MTEKVPAFQETVLFFIKRESNEVERSIEMNIRKHLPVIYIVLIFGFVENQTYDTEDNHIQAKNFDGVKEKGGYFNRNRNQFSEQESTQNISFANESSLQNIIHLDNLTEAEKEIFTSEVWWWRSFLDAVFLILQDLTQTFIKSNEVLQLVFGGIDWDKYRERLVNIMHDFTFQGVLVVKNYFVESLRFLEKLIKPSDTWFHESADNLDIIYQLIHRINKAI